jgi:cytochrome c biogenesis protein
MDKIFEVQMRQMHEMQRQMDAMFDNFTQNFQTPSLMQTPMLVHSSGVLSSGFQDKGDHYELAIRINDLSNSKVDITSENGMITIATTLNKKEERTKGKYGKIISYANSSSTQSFTLPGGVEETAAKAQKALEHGLGKVYRQDQGEAKTLLAQKGAWSRLGVYVVHLSVLIIFAGAIVGGVWGFGGFVSIDQGASVDHIQLDNGQTRPLGFSVRLDKFTLTKYQGKEIPSEYRSDVTFLAGGEEVKKASLIVNDPAEFDGIVFYQSSYGQRPSSMKLRMIRGEQTVELDLVPRRWNNLPGGGRAGVMDFREHVAMGSMYHGPIARVIYQADGQEPMALTAFKPGAKVPARGPVRFEILDVVSTPYTGLQVKYDPGVWLVWAGCTLMVIGFIIAFYLSHRKVWIRISPTPSGRARVEIAGSTNKNRPGLDRLMMRLAGRIKQGE